MLAGDVYDDDAWLLLSFVDDAVDDADGADFRRAWRCTCSRWRGSACSRGVRKEHFPTGMRTIPLVLHTGPLLAYFWNVLDAAAGTGFAEVCSR